MKETLKNVIKIDIQLCNRHFKKKLHIRDAKNKKIKK